MHHLMVARLHFAHRHAPARGGGGFQHLPRTGADAPHRLEEMPDAA
jgi:hypothetical protein